MPRHQGRDVGTRVPALHPGDGVIDRQGIGKHPATGAQAEKAEQAHRRHADLAIPAERVLPPAGRPRVQPVGVDLRVQAVGAFRWPG